MGVLCLIWSLEVPVDGGRCGHLTPHLTGDAAQFEAFIGNGLCVWVHLHTGSMAQRGYRVEGWRTQLETSCITSLLFVYLQVTGFRGKSRGWPSSSFVYPWLEGKLDIRAELWCFPVSQYLQANCLKVLYKATLDTVTFVFLRACS